MIDDRDTELVRRFQRGDIAAFETFIENNQDRLHRLARSFLYEDSLADDAVQEVFIRAYKGLPKFRFASKPFSWMYRTLKNVCAEINRKNRHETGRNEYEEQGHDDSQSHEHAESLKKIHEAMQTLARRERDVVLLRVFEEFSEKETAAVLGVKNGTVKTLLHRGLKKLKSKCGDIVEE